MQGVGAVEMSNGDQPVIGITTKYQDPGIYTVEVCSAYCASSLILVLALFASCSTVHHLTHQSTTQAL